METLRDQILLRIVKIFNAILETVPFAVCWYYAYSKNLASPFYGRGNFIIILLFFVLYIAYAKIYEGFNIALNRISENVGSQALALFISDFIMYIITLLLYREIPSFIPVLICFIIQLFVSVAWSYLIHIWYFYAFPAKDTGIVYGSREGIENLISSYGLEKRFKVTKIESIETVLADPSVFFDKIENVFFSGIHSHERNILLKICVEKNIKVYVIPRVGDAIMSGAKKLHMFHLPMLQVGRYNPSPEYLFVKRVFDIAISLIALVILSPIMLVTAIAIKITDHGPVFYKQCRLTKNGKKFDVLKFRSMRVDAEKDGVARLSTGVNDDRITPVGKFIRKCRIDELPQLLNILSGSMSIVGPRPERPEIAEQYEQELPEFSLRLQAKAGLTGYAQVYGKYNTIPYDKLMMDLMYIANPKFSEDLKIMFATVKILFVADSTEGVEEGKTTASL